MTQMTDIDPRDAAGAFGYDASLPRRARAVDIALGAAMIVAGVLAITLPATRSLAVNVLPGAAFAVLAADRAVDAWKAEAKSHRVAAGLMSAGFLIGALAVAFDPLAGLAAASLAAVALLFAGGIGRIVEGLRRSGRSRVWRVAAGAASVLASLMLLASFPATALWLLGTLAGLSFILDGLSRLAAPAEDAMAPPPG